MRVQRVCGEPDAVPLFALVTCPPGFQGVFCLQQNKRSPSPCWEGDLFNCCVGTAGLAAGRLQLAENFFFLAQQVGKSVAAEGVGQFGTNLPPGAMNRTEDVTFAGAFLNQALIEIQRTFLGLNHLEQCDLLGVLEEIKSPSDATLGADYADFDQWLKYFGQKGRGDILGPADIFFEYNLAAWLLGEKKHSSNGVFCGAGDEHG